MHRGCGFAPTRGPHCLIRPRVRRGCGRGSCGSKRGLTGPARLHCRGASVDGTPSCPIRGPPTAELTV
ncbi:hypothetical protein NDU88_011226 [Pleurodeles waltl]|uniref:Uncharacterized protein n=1 Tax=Pleurodeles waltl TaxID=8319 RepID=A0AAV7Q102_PLEWA|nr:hypothetical protein NDU88_011226 [Pleurodeles waltl]